MAPYLHVFLNVPGSIHDSAVGNFGDHYKLLTHVYDHNGGKGVMDSAFARANYDFIIKSGQEVYFDLVEKITQQTDKPQLHGNMLNRERMHFKDPFLGCMVDSDTKRQGR